MNNKVSIPNGAWVMVADHSKALLLKNNGSPTSPDFEVKQVLEAPENPPTRDQGVDQPGRAFSPSSGGGNRSAMEETDWHAAAARRFMEEAANAIDKARIDNEIAAIVLVAPPRALSELRDFISDGVKAVLVGEVHKDLTGMPVKDIESHLTA